MKLTIPGVPGCNLNGSQVYFTTRLSQAIPIAQYDDRAETEAAVEKCKCFLTIVTRPASVSCYENAVTSLKIWASAAKMPNALGVSDCVQFISLQKIISSANEFKSNPETDLFDYMIAYLPEQDSELKRGRTIGVCKFNLPDIEIIGGDDSYGIRREQLRMAARMMIYRRKGFENGEKVALGNQVFRAEQITHRKFDNDPSIRLTAIGKIIATPLPYYYRNSN